MECPKCKKIIDNNSKYCLFCGKKIISEQNKQTTTYSSAKTEQTRTSSSQTYSDNNSNNKTNLKKNGVFYVFCVVIPIGCAAGIVFRIPFASSSNNPANIILRAILLVVSFSIYGIYRAIKNKSSK